MFVSAIKSTSNYGVHPNFRRKIGGEEFPDKVIKEAETIMNGSMKVDVNKYKKDFFECMEDVKIQPLEWLLLPYAKFLEKIGGSDGDIEEVRTGLGIATLGITELLKTPEAGIRKMISNAKAEKFASQVERCMLAMIREKKI